MMTHAAISTRLAAIDIEWHQLAIECGRIGHDFGKSATCCVCGAMRIDPPTAPIQALMRAVEMFGTRVKLAAAIGTTKASINNWLNEGELIPLKRCPEIERVTKGAVRCEELRPDLDWGVLRKVRVASRERG